MTAASVRDAWTAAPRRLAPALRRVLTAGLLIPGLVLGIGYLLAKRLGVWTPDTGFEHPLGLWLLLAAPLYAAARVWLLYWQRPRLRISSVRLWGAAPPRGRHRLRTPIEGCAAASLALMAVGLAGPRAVATDADRMTQGIDIVVAMDVSLSMQASDIRPSRFEASRAVVDAFIQRRSRDRIGAVVFGRDAYTLMPLTTDHRALRNVLTEVQLGLVDGRGTAIGNAVGVALNRLRESEAESKVVILLTDGESNSGNLAPLQAAGFAAEIGVKLYPILMGGRKQAGSSPMDLFDRMLGQGQEFPVNPELLEKMAAQTQGRAFQAEDRRELEQSFHAILDELERSDIEDVAPRYRYLVTPVVGLAALLLLLYLIGRRWLLRSFA